MSQLSSTSSGGIGLTGILTIIFVLFKLFGKITWSWYWVFSPLIISTGLTLAVILVIFVIGILLAILDQ